MAKCRIGHFMEARILEALEVDFIDESEVLTPGRRRAPHRQARRSRCRSSAAAAISARRCAASARARRCIRTKGEAGHRQHRRGGAPPARGARRRSGGSTTLGARGAHDARRSSLGAPLELVARGRARAGGCRCRASPRAASRRRPTRRSAWRSAPRRSSSAAASSSARTPRGARAPSSRRRRTGRTRRSSRDVSTGLGGAMRGARAGDSCARGRALAARGW